MFERGANTLASKGHFYLPLPDALRDDTAVRWADQDLMSVQDIFVAGTGASMGDRAGAAVSGVLVGQAAGGAFNIARDALGVIPGIGAALQSVASNMISADAVNAFVQQSIGAAQNPNPSVIFKEPDLRDYQITWTFAPRNERESINTRNVIQALKRAALPTPRYNNTMAVLNYPALVQVNFFPWDADGIGSNKYGHDPNKSIIRYKTSVMRSVNVNYAPSNVPSFYAKGNHPAFIQLSITFKEVEYALSNDWGGALSGQDTGSAPEEIFNVLKEQVITPGIEVFREGAQSLSDFAADFEGGASEAPPEPES
jgi:hypothetical protein